MGSIIYGLHYLWAPLSIMRVTGQKPLILQLVKMICTWYYVPSPLDLRVSLRTQCPAVGEGAGWEGGREVPLLHEGREGRS